MNIPFVFRGLHQTRSHDMKYWDLSSYKFSVEEKLFLAHELLEHHTFLVPTNINVKTGFTRTTCSGLARRYSVPESTFSHWKCAVRNGEALYVDGGRPKALDEVALQSIHDKVVESMKSTETLAIYDLGELVRIAHGETLARHGKRVLPQDLPSVSDSVVMKTRKTLHIVPREPEILTKGRLTALRDIRAAYRVACMFEAFGGHLPACKKWNADATQFLIQKDGAGAMQCFIYQDDPHYDQRFDSSTVPDPMGMIVKWIAMASAEGDLSPVVLLFPQKELGEEDFYAEECSVLTASNEYGAKAGWLYFCHSRAGNCKLWHHWYLNVVIPTLLRCLERHGREQRLLFYTDGELKVLNEAFDDEVLRGFADVLTDYVKGEPGTTSKWQSLDGFFREFKAGLKALIRKKTCPEYPTLRQSVHAVLSRLEQHFATLALHLTPLYKNQVVMACERVIHTMRSGYVSADRFQRCFVSNGQHRAPSFDGDITTNYDTIISSSLAQGITDEELTIMQNSRADVVAEFRRAGKVLNPFLDERNIPKPHDAPNRDNFTLCRQDCLLLTHIDTIRAWHAAHPLPRAHPPPTAQAAAQGVTQRQLTEAEKLIQREEQKQARKEAKEAAKREEQARLQSLSLEALKEEKRQKNGSQGSKGQ